MCGKTVFDVKWFLKRRSFIRVKFDSGLILYQESWENIQQFGDDDNEDDDLYDAGNLSTTEKKLSIFYVSAYKQAKETSFTLY